MIVIDPANESLDTRHDELRRRYKLLRRHVSCPIEMLAGPDDLTADRGVLCFQHPGDLGDSPTVVVQFDKNGHWGIPVELLTIPGVDSTRRSTDAFIACGPSPRERELKCVSFQLACNEDAERHWRYDAMIAGTPVVNSSSAVEDESLF